MRNRWSRFLPLFLAALWLPFQAIAATAMPLCRHGETHKAMAMVEEAAEHCHMPDSQPAPVDHGMACDDCGFCHLAGAGFMPASAHAAVVIPIPRDYNADAPLAPPSAVPEPPQQPPKRLA